VQNREELWSGPWDGDPTMIETSPAWGALIATSEGFLDLGPGVAFSPDGASWTEASGPAANYRIQVAAPHGDDVLAVTEAGMGSLTIFLLDATGATVTDVAGPELDAGFSAWGPISSPAMFVMPNSTDPDEQQNPSLLATADAQTWMLEEMSDFEPNMWRPPDIAAANDTTVLVAMYGTEPDDQVWQRFTMPG